MTNSTANPLKKSKTGTLNHKLKTCIKGRCKLLLQLAFLLNKMLEMCFSGVIFSLCSINFNLLILGVHVILQWTNILSRG